MASSSLQQQIASMRQSLFDEGILDEQFNQLENFEDDRAPDHVDSIINIYFSTKYFEVMEQALEETPVDIATLSSCLQTFKGSSVSIGAKSVTIEIDKMLQCYRIRDIEASRAAVQSMKQAYNTLQNKLEAYLELRRQAALAQSSNPSSGGKRSIW
ncbi:pseudo histidine-containing phosphotransfer protein 2-like [Fagus crenata]